MGKRNGGVDGRGQHPNSQAALRAHQVQPGQVLNPTGERGAPFRLYSDAIKVLCAEPLPEYLRVALNHRFRLQLSKELIGERIDGKRVTMAAIPEMFEPGITWGRANALRLHISAIFNGDIAAAIEVREASEGRATQRVEFQSQNDKLEQLLDAFRRVAEMSDEQYDAAMKPKVVQ